MAGELLKIDYRLATSRSSPGIFSSADILNSAEVAEVTAASEEGIAASLNYCKSRVVVPYLRLLASVGLRPLSPNGNSFATALSVLHLMIVLCLLVVGYGLQFLSCFRRDLGPHGPTKGDELWEEKCPLALVVFNFAIPSVLHLLTYLYVLYLFRVKDIEQLPTLMERVFVVSCSPGEGPLQPKSIARSLWLLVALAGAWLVLSVVTFALALALDPPIFRWIYLDPVIVRVFLATGTVVQDAVQSTLVSGYCLQAHLLTLLATALRQRALQHTLSPLDWMREVKEFHELLRHLNQRLAPAVCVLALVSASWALSGIITIVQNPETTQVFLAALPVLLWTSLAVAPFIMAARLSKHCDDMREVGHEIRTRPFVYQDVPSTELDSLLLFASTLKLRPSLFGTPVTGRNLCIMLSLFALVVLVVGQILPIQSRMSSQ